MAITRVNINPKILTWAIERVGKDVDNFLILNPKVRQWIEGIKQPTLKELEKFAKSLYVPFGYLFLDEPPLEECPIPFFRSTTNQQNNLNIYDTVLALQERQEWLSDYLENEGEDKLALVGIIDADLNKIEEASLLVHQIMGIPINWAFEHRSIDDAIKFLISILEDKGIIMSFNGVVGLNNSRPIPVKECRGFSLIDEYCPFIFVNNKDAKQAQVFTIFHEFVHILIGYSAGYGDTERGTPQTDLEKFCDKVAALSLVPSKLFIAEWGKTGEDYEVLSKKFKVSRYVLARRAKELGLISDQHYFMLYNRWQNEPIQINQQADKNGGNFYPSVLRKTSRTFLAHVNNAVTSNRLLHLDAYRLTGLKGDTFHKVINSREFSQA